MDRYVLLVSFSQTDDEAAEENKREFEFLHNFSATVTAANRSSV